MLLPNPILIPAATVATLGGTAAAFMAWSVFMPASNTFGPVQRRISQAHAVALTFDDGPTDPSTAQVLDILAEHHMHATFFVVGRNVKTAPALTRRIADEGHAIGNHSWDHHHFGICGGTGYWRDQIVRTNQIVFDTTGLRQELFRPPMGFKSWHLAAAARELHMPLMGWSLRAFDTCDVSPERIVNRLTRQLRSGQIVALHDGVEPSRFGSDQSRTVAALPSVLRAVESLGFTAVPLRAGPELRTSPQVAMP